MKKKIKLYVVTKYIYAVDIPSAIRAEKQAAPDDVYLDQDFRKGNMESVELKKAGFKS